MSLRVFGRREPARHVDCKPRATRPWPSVSALKPIMPKTSTIPLCLHTNSGLPPVACPSDVCLVEAGASSRGQGSTSAFRRPGLVIAGRRRPRIGGQGRARRAPGLRRAGQIRLMRQFPSARGVLFLGWRNIKRVMKPAIPALRGHGPVALPGINDPAALETERLVDFPGPV